MAEIINLRMARKQKARTEREKTAVENRALHAGLKAEPIADRTASDRASTLLDGLRREPAKDATDER